MAGALGRERSFTNTWFPHWKVYWLSWLSCGCGRGLLYFMGKVSCIFLRYCFHTKTQGDNRRASEDRQKSTELQHLRLSWQAALSHNYQLKRCVIISPDCSCVVKWKWYGHHHTAWPFHRHVVARVEAADKASYNLVEIFQISKVEMSRSCHHPSSEESRGRHAHPGTPGKWGRR